MKRWCPHCSTELTYCIIEKDGEQRQSSFASDSEPIPEPSAREADGERSTAFVGLQRAEASGVGSDMKAEGAGNSTKAAEPTATAVEREVTATIGLPNRGDDSSELVLLTALEVELREAASKEFDIEAGVRVELYHRSMAVGRSLLLAAEAVRKAINKIASVQPNAEHDTRH